MLYKHAPLLKKTKNTMEMKNIVYHHYNLTYVADTLD